MIKDPHFSLDLGPPWVEVPNDDPDQYNFRDADRDIVITLSAMSLGLAAEGLESFADRFVQVRLNAEADAARAYGHRSTIYEPIVVPRSWGRALAYYGHDDGGRQFSFSGMVTLRAAISLYMSSGTLSERALMQAMDEVGSQIVFDRVPLDTI